MYERVQVLCERVACMKVHTHIKMGARAHGMRTQLCVRDVKLLLEVEVHKSL